jgi:hypothetical protein
MRIKMGVQCVLSHRRLAARPRPGTTWIERRVMGNDSGQMVESSPITRASIRVAWSEKVDPTYRCSQLALIESTVKTTMARG